MKSSDMRTALLSLILYYITLEYGNGVIDTITSYLFLAAAVVLFGKQLYTWIKQYRA
jgi:hypothetical protein